MFGSLFKNKTNANSEPIEYTITPCSCDDDNECCDLILQLRKYQDFEKEIKNQIDCLSSDCNKSLDYFVNFLKKLENNGFRMNGNGIVDCFHNRCMLGRTINEHSSADIWRITEELKTYRNKEDILSEKQSALKVVRNDISNIKAKLGIEQHRKVLSDEKSKD